MPVTDNDLNHILEHTEQLWQKLCGKKIFVTGGTGFFGKWLLESFAWANKQLGLKAQMLVLSREPDLFKRRYPHPAKAADVKFHKGDIRNFDFPEGHFDFIIHAAAEASAKLNTEKPLLMIDTIIEGTRRVLDFARQRKAKRLLFISSGAVYGRQPPDIPLVSEDYLGAPDSTQPVSAYREGKRLAELLCSIYQAQYGLEATIARSFALVGPYLNLDIHFAIGNFIRDGLKGDTINVLGDGSPFRSYLYAADLAIWLWTILLKGQSGWAYNVGSDKEINIADLALLVSKCFPQHPEVKIAQTPVPGKAPERYVPCIDRAKKELKLHCWIELDEAIRRTIDFYKSGN